MIRCDGCKKTFKTEAAFERHAPACTGDGKHKPLGQMTMEELMAMYEREQAAKVRA